jgi:hypothetical protein
MHAVTSEAAGGSPVHRCLHWPPVQIPAQACPQPPQFRASALVSMH